MTMNPRIAPHVASRPFPLNIQHINQKRLTITNQLQVAIKTLLIGPVLFPLSLCLSCVCVCVCVCVCLCVCGGVSIFFPLSLFLVKYQHHLDGMITKYYLSQLLLN